MFITGKISLPHWSNYIANNKANLCEIPSKDFGDTKPKCLTTASTSQENEHICSKRYYVRYTNRLRLFT